MAEENAQVSRDIGKANIITAEQRSSMFEERTKLQNELIAAQTIQDTTQSKAIQQKIDAVESVLAGDTREHIKALAGVDSGFVSPIPAIAEKRRAEESRLKGEKDLAKVGITLAESDENSGIGVADFYNTQMAIKKKPFMYYWADTFGPGGKWKRARIPKGFTYEDIVFTSLLPKHNMSQSDVLKKMGALK